MNLKCLTCKNLHIHGYGWSDWTWEGDELVCVKKLFETTEKDDVNEMILANIIKDCLQYEAGEPYEESPDGNNMSGNKAQECEKC